MDTINLVFDEESLPVRAGTSKSKKDLTSTGGEIVSEDPIPPSREEIEYLQNIAKHRREQQAADQQMADEAAANAAPEPMPLTEQAEKLKKRLIQEHHEQEDGES